MKKVLLITYYWPPAGGPGVQRVLKFVKFLRGFGWEPVVLTVEQGDYPALDQSLEKEIPDGTVIHKLPIYEPHNLYRKLSGGKPGAAIPVAVLAEKENLSLSKKIMHWIRANIVIPDARIGWYFTAVRPAATIIQKEEIDAILVSSPPHSLQLIGRKLARITGKPFLADFRDPWTDIHYYDQSNRKGFARRIDAWLERSVLRACHRLITVSPALARQLHAKVEKLNFQVIYNGFDPDDFSDNSTSPKAEKFVLSYIGNLKANQNPAALWKVLAELLATDSDFAGHFKLEFVGRQNPDTEALLKESGLENRYVFKGYVSHNEATRAMQQAAALLFIIPRSSKNKGILTGKLFDYLAAGTPLLSVGPPDGDAAAILQETAAGPMIDYDDVPGLRHRITELFGDWKSGRSNLRPDREKVSRYQRQAQTGVLARVLDELIIQENE
jgi:glycosyltransferase involved in cell wall biosynthesis